MKRISQFLAASLLIVPLFAGAQNETAEQFRPILGSWKGDLDGATVAENWEQKDESTFLGEGYVVADGDTIIREVLRIQKIGSYWNYIPVINDSKPTLFTLVEMQEDKWVFENNEHDFPQRVIYTIQKDGSLLAWIEGEMDGKFLKEEYLMKPLR